MLHVDTRNNDYRHGANRARQPRKTQAATTKKMDSVANHTLDVARQLSTANLQSLLVMALRMLEARGLANDSDRATLALLVMA